MNERKWVCSAASLYLAILLISACFSNFARAQADMFSPADPAKYTLYGCKQLAEARPYVVYRIQKIEGLMAKAAAGPGGGFASSMAYNGDYSILRGDLQNLDARAADRNCPPLPQGAAAPPGEVQMDAAPPSRRNPSR